MLFRSFVDAVVSGAELENQALVDSMKFFREKTGQCIPFGGKVTHDGKPWSYGGPEARLGRLLSAEGCSGEYESPAESTHVRDTGAA